MRSTLTLGLTCLLVICGMSSLAWAESVCDGTSKISIPIFPNSPTSPTFEYSYRYVFRSSVAATIVYIPGGPGATSIYLGMSDSVLSTLIPPGFNVILTDPRGVGCNAAVARTFPSTAFSSDILASDVLAVIGKLKLKNYFVMGHSYGTLLSTVIVKRAISGEAHAPKALVLQGIVGHNLQEPYSGFQMEWENVKRHMPREVAEKLSAKQLPFGLSPQYWGAFISGELIAGTIPGQPNLAEQLGPLNGGDEKALEDLKQAVITRGEHQSSPDYLRVYMPIWCQEIASTDNTDMALINGLLVGKQNPHFCDGYSLVNPYDSKNWQMSVPIFYFQGKRDPATIPSQAFYHFQNQTHARRFFVTVPDAGHAPFANLADCRNAVWKSMDKLGEGFQDAVKSCSIKPNLHMAESAGF